MSAPGIVSGRNLVIASVQTNATGDQPLFFIGDEIPAYRPNGGDLLQGDIYYDSSSEIMYFWSGAQWVISGGPGIFDDILARLEAIERSLNTIVAERSISEYPET